MNETPQSLATPAEKSERTEHVAPCLADFPDVLTIPDVLRLLRISRRSYNRMVRHYGFIDPIENVPGVRYAKSLVAEWINRRPAVAGRSKAVWARRSA